MGELPLPRKPRERIKRNPLIFNLSRLKWEALTSGRIKPVVYDALAAADAALAHMLVESGRHIGKIVLTWKNV
jgi:NADPH2:quinone reductase